MSAVIVSSVFPKNFISQVAVSAGWLCYKNEFLFLQRTAESSEALSWGVPGGKVESNETPAIALAREIYEETKVCLSSAGIQYMDCLYISKPG